ncbi:accessory Sec system translocase SecA2 [Halobacillus karajensis]|uniref:Protein translocase subunit SecA n=1 Tax=Halobacillus karajensis TaxID=195088 RepID=A0A059NWU7_9BACI|nr:accessory Sec system translocase SecA2 [Halobacillus karajensis]CDQ18933.1 preprotein translocase subunit SecA [Halobacillus karajensis]CDQ22994.1 preprotein translocase subunit SecA [Halobacillus karajensis]CDQ26476.1 preprotein translocase subunit SecA [Halobacillus karajensis]
MIESMKKILPLKKEHQWEKYEPSVRVINDLENQMKILTDDQLKAKTTQFQKQLHNGSTIYDIREEAFAVVREAASRVLGMRHFDVQLVGGLVLTDGNISEMATGEGKTLVATLPSYLKALEGKGVHVITVNEYLARRDYETMGPLHEFLGLSVGLNVPQISQTEKRAAYKADITYGIGTEFGFDFLRDHMVKDLNQKVQRPYHFAIVDEIDSVLVDEAKTPLIIAGKMKSSANLHKVGAKLARSFKKDHDYEYDVETKSVTLTENGMTKIERAFAIDNLFDIEHQTLYHYMIQAIRARVMFERDVDYIVEDNELKLVDLFTGRLMQGRTMSDGLHQALEAKEGLAISEENKPQASLTVQNYFRMYPSLSGMTGTAKTEEKEFQTVYGMDVVEIPTNKPVLRDDRPDKVFVTKEQKYEELVREVENVHQTGQPILIGISSILQSDQVAEYLDRAGFSYELLNAKSMEQEVQLISLAGQKGNITIATNMAGRGTDIKLSEKAADLGGLHVIGTERHESRRIDHQLKGRSGRQGDPGSSQFIISLEDDMIERFAQVERDRKLKSIKTGEYGQVLNKDLHKFIDTVQKISEGSHYNIRELTLKLDDVINDQRKVIYELRDKVLQEPKVLSLLSPMVNDFVTYEVDRHCPETIVPENWPLEHLEAELQRGIPLMKKMTLSEYSYETTDDVKQAVRPTLDAYLLQLEEAVTPAIESSWKQGAVMKLDQLWIRHLEMMNRLKEGIGIRQYQQEDPIRLYQKDGLDIFGHHFYQIKREFVILMAALCRPAKKGENKGGKEDV